MKFKLLLSLLVLVHAAVLAQNKGSISGIVKTADGKPAAYVTVSLKGTNRGTSTNASGEYEIRNIPAGKYTLVASFIGLETKSQEIAVTGGAIVIPEIILTESARQLNEIVVSDYKTNPYDRKISDHVSKLPLKYMENAQVYTTIPQELLKQQLVFSVDDGIRNAPGIQKMWEATGRGGDGGAYYNSRGFIVQSQLRNGLAGNVTSRVDAANLESIEVIKGPSATLFGSTLTSYGGLINRITKKPYKKLGGEITYSTGSYSFNRISADINTPLDEEKNVLLRINTAYNYEGSFQDNGFDKALVFAPSLFYQVNDRLSFSVDAELYTGENSSKQFIFFYYPAAVLGASRAEDLGVDYMRSYSAGDIFQTSKNSNFFGQMNYKISDTWTSQTSYASTHSFSDGPYAYFYLVPNSEVTGDPNATGSDYLQRADQSTANSVSQVTELQQNFIGEFNLGGLRNRFVGGLDLFSQNSNQLFYGTNFDIIPKDGVTEKYGNFNADKLDSALMNGTPWTWPARYKTNTYSAYISDVLNITESLILSAALRIDHFDNLGDYDQASGKYSDAYTQTALSPKFGLVYQPVKDKVSLFANYQNGFTNKPGQSFEGTSFKPEQANQVEGGVKMDALNGRLHTIISYYNISVENVLRPDPEHANFSIQDGTQISKGVEVEVIANPVDGLNVMAGFAYNDSKLEKAEDDVEGRRPTTAMSPYAANLWVGYQLPQGALQGLGFGFGGNYASDNKILNSVFYGEFTLPAYTVLNATVFYNHPKFRVGVKADNLTDKKYWIGYTTMNPQKLRSIVASFTFKF